jgi:hypothetical protein
MIVFLLAVIAATLLYMAGLGWVVLLALGIVVAIVLVGILLVGAEIAFEWLEKTWARLVAAFYRRSGRNAVDAETARRKSLGSDD